ncbi:MAG: hypothetical protein AVDCRST_MAG86-3123 [uncultured Truepera sp.]|uniref:Uncharacterized protein n=1 Tax=uncultured Truepera sp. TaxID=543023 RepID=A0A6J4VRU7_9DEIN|nr:MAG: hypothetical protein AVDCRST_MAG86-3123 [uncultured Truepera sp.]
MTVLTIVLMALVTYLPRLAGLSLASFVLPPFWSRFLRFVPTAVFAALVVPALPSAGRPRCGSSQRVSRPLCSGGCGRCGSGCWWGWSCFGDCGHCRVRATFGTNR